MKHKSTQAIGRAGGKLQLRRFDPKEQYCKFFGRAEKEWLLANSVGSLHHRASIQT
jgi:hypothetical protein